MEWLLLVVLVPAVVVPIVLLFGFTGCAAILGLDDVGYKPTDPATTPDPVTKAPTNLRATDIKETVITIAWDHDQASTVEFIISREDATNGKIDTFAKVAKGGETKFEDNGGIPGLPVVPGVVYYYTVTASNPALTKESDAANRRTNPLPVRSLKWEIAYDNPIRVTDPTDPANFAGQCLVQRIDHTIYENFGGTSVKQVRLHLRGVGNSNTNTQFTEITVSHAAPPGVPTPDAFDSEAQPVPFGPVAIPSTPTTNGQVRIIGPVNFALDRNKDLIVAFDVSPANANPHRARLAVGASQAFAGAGTQAIIQDRNGLVARQGAGVYVIEKIEVLTA